ncbi:MAG: hypothetical protein WCG29_03485 [Desulfomonile sp.]|jgi:recombination associated protein RdgC|nr:hypothetical protein [Deltaproteobacteria bacterium]
MDFLDVLKEKAFLGREFLTWLWFKSDRSGGRIDIPGKKVIEVFFLDKMTLDLSDSDSPETVTLKGGQSELREGLAALREGKKIEEARVSIRAMENDFTMVIKGTWFCFGAFRTPPALPPEASETDEDREGSFLEKVYLIEEGLGHVDTLFEYFLKLRISEQWELAELPALRKWIETSRG